MESVCWLWVGCLIGVAGGWVTRSLLSSPYTPVQTLVYWVNLTFVRILWRAEVPPKLPLAAGQGAVIIANHRSSIDPFFIQVTAGRQVHWLVAAEFAQIKIVAWLYQLTGAIPVKRAGRDTAATKFAIGLAKKGGLVGMFPEGTINTTTDFMLSVRPGAIMIAMKANVPVLPCYIDGSPYGGTALSPMMMLARVKLHIGEPIDVHSYLSKYDEKTALQMATQVCVKGIADLAGRSEFEPELAGRRWTERTAG